MEQSLAVFQGKKIRKTWHNNEWWFSILDIVQILSNSSDPKQYIKKMRQRDSALNSRWGTICTPLEMIALDGKKRLVNSVNTEAAFRVIQSIPSPRAEPFKLWLAKVGYERVQEIQNPELMYERMRKMYLQKGYSESWIKRRFDSIDVRTELTDEWKKRNVSSDKEFAMLTNEISQKAFGMTIEEYKTSKKIKNKNLRDYMTDLELLFNMVAERSTLEIMRVKDSKGFDENLIASKKGGKVARAAKDVLDKEIK